MRLIDATAVMVQIPYEEFNARMVIAYAPTVDAEPVKHGRWIGVSQTKFEKLFFHSRVFKCSVCGNYLDFDGVNSGRGSGNYCPNCGAKMDKDWEEPEINPCRGCADYDGRGGCKSNGGCGTKINEVSE